MIYLSSRRVLPYPSGNFITWIFFIVYLLLITSRIFTENTTKIMKFFMKFLTKFIKKFFTEFIKESFLVRFDISSPASPTEFHVHVIIVKIFITLCHTLCVSFLFFQWMKSYLLHPYLSHP